MKKFFFISLIILLTSFKNYQADATLNFDYEVKYTIAAKEHSVFASKTNANEFLICYKENNFFTFLQGANLFNIIISDSNEVRVTEFQGNIPKELFSEIVETNETKTINNLICNKYIAQSSMKKSTSIEVFISKNHKINNVNFLLTSGIKSNSKIKGLVVEVNSINNKTNESRLYLSLNEIKNIKKIIKINAENLKKLIAKEEYLKKHKNNVQITIE